jgi:hypothetical protein
MTPNKTDFKAALRKELLARYGPEGNLDKWAANPERLERFMASVETTLTTNRNTVGIDSDSFRAAYKAIGGKGPLTYKALRSLPEASE